MKNVSRPWNVKWFAGEVIGFVLDYMTNGGRAQLISVVPIDGIHIRIILRFPKIYQKFV